MGTLFGGSDNQIVGNVHQTKNIKINGIIDTRVNRMNHEKWTDLFTKWLDNYGWSFGGITVECTDE